MRSFLPFLPIHLHFYTLILGALGGLLLGAPAHAQAPTLTGFTPAANDRAAPRSAGVVARFSQPLTAASATALKVFGSQRGGLRGGGIATVAGATLALSSASFEFQPGETVQATVTRGVAGTGGFLAQPWVQQFTAAVTGPGRGSFGGGSEVFRTDVLDVATGDVDGDGDLDLVVASAFSNTAQVVRNGGNASGSGTGTFSGSPQPVPTGTTPVSLVLADVDGDGDLDLLTANRFGNSVSVRLNGGNASGSGTGVFTGGQAVAVGTDPQSVAVGDLDGDGDLDLATANMQSNTVSVRLNGGDATGSGTGLFSTDWTYDIAVQEFADGNAPYTIAGPWAIAAFTEAGIDVAVDPIPSAGGQTAAPFVGVQGFYLSAQTDQALVATDFLTNYIATPEAMLALHEADPRIPAFSEIAEQVAADPVIAGFLASSKNGTPMPSIPEMGNVWEFWNSAEAAIITGTTAPADAWSTMLTDVGAAIGG